MVKGYALPPMRWWSWGLSGWFGNDMSVHRCLFHKLKIEREVAHRLNQYVSFQIVY